MKSYYNFFGFGVCLESESNELIELINKNFSVYVSYSEIKVHLSIQAKLSNDLNNKIPKNLEAIKQSINSVSYQENQKRYNDYYGKAITVLDYSRNDASIWALDLNRLHELTYLLIMSRQGKWCDKNGIHKIHAMGIKGKSKNLLLMLPMKGGKSTMFAKFLSETNYGLISDDSPVVNSDGTIENFNIRFGLEKKPMYESLLEQVDPKYIFSLQREQYGEKILVDIKAFEKRIGQPHSKSLLVQGVRVNNDEIDIYMISKLEMFRYTFVNMTIGVGLPMIIEYFIENSIKDHFGNLVIFSKRLKASISLILKSDCYFAKMGSDIHKNFEALEKLARK